MVNLVGVLPSNRNRAAKNGVGDNIDRDLVSNSSETTGIFNKSKSNGKVKSRGSRDDIQPTGGRFSHRSTNNGGTVDTKGNSPSVFEDQMLGQTLREARGREKVEMIKRYFREARGREITRGRGREWNLGESVSIGVITQIKVGFFRNILLAQL